ncbi:MAG: MIP family channel protein [Planctomycetota bacterium]
MPDPDLTPTTAAADKPAPLLSTQLAGEVLGAFLLVFFGVGSVHVAVTTGELQGLGQVAAVWGLGVGLAIYATAAVSGAHLNPAVTLAMTVLRGFPAARVLPYFAAQLVGAVAAAALLNMLFGGAILAFEAANDITRGAPGSERSAMMYGEYFPNPAVFGEVLAHAHIISLPMAVVAEAVGTALLVLFIFALTDSRNPNAPSPRGVALCIGFAVAAIICIVAPLTQAGLNPARDFGPRLVAYFTGWGDIAIPGPRGGFFYVYILGPLVGGIAGGAAYEALIAPGLRSSPNEPRA